MQATACPYRSVLEDGRITCQKIAAGDKEVSAGICLLCPARACSCGFLRFSLEKIALTPITVRWGNGRVEVWDDQPPRVSFLRSACALNKAPVSSPADCLACSLRESPSTTMGDPLRAPHAPVALRDNVVVFVRRAARPAYRPIRLFLKGGSLCP